MDRAPLDYDAVKRVPIGALLARYNIELRRVGTQLVGCCPIHHGSNRRQFTVDPAKGLWKCFGDCKAGGSTIDLVAALEGVAPRDAAMMIAKWFAIAPPSVGRRQYNRRRSKVSGERPSHKCYVVEDRDEAEAGSDEDRGWWTRVGSAWPHKDGKGLNIVLSALPVNGRLVLREYSDEDAKKDDEKQKAKRVKK